jgi:hypothetical protein
MQPRRLVYEEHAPITRQRIAKHHTLLHIQVVHFDLGANLLPSGQRDFARKKHVGTFGFRTAATGPHERQQYGPRQ